MSRTILVIEDEADIRELLRVNLEGEGFRVVESPDGERGFAMVESEDPDLLVLDLMLPGMPGIEVCRRVRASDTRSGLPILMLTAKAAEADKIVGLEAGADDYVTKPFSPREVAARVKALLRRAAASSQKPSRDSYRRGGIEVDFATYEVRVDGRAVDLSLREFELLRFFVKNPNRVYERRQLLELVWGPDTFVEPRTVDVHVRRLRKQVERNDAAPERIVTVRGVGYMFDERAGAPNS